MLYDRRNNPVVKIIDSKLAWEAYCRTGSVHRAGQEFGVNGDTVWKTLVQAGYKLNRSAWTQSEIDKLTAYFLQTDRVDFSAAEIANAIGRTTSAIEIKASRLGITLTRSEASTQWSDAKKQNVARSAKERGAALSSEDRLKRSVVAKHWHSENAHPRGMLGKTHSVKTRKAISAFQLQRWESITPEEKRLHTDARLRSRAKNNGGVLPREHSFGSWKSGWAEVGGKRCFFRSLWEKNYAHFLEYLKGKNWISEWAHEPKTFWFDSVKRGSNNYTPDFHVTTWCGVEEYHEVKGWMDERSKMKICRMRTHFPMLTLIVRDSKWFKANRDLEFQVPGWKTLSQRKVQKGEEEGAEITIFPPNTW